MSSTHPDHVRIELGARSYDVVVGDNLIANAGALISEKIGRTKVFIVSDENVAAVHLENLKQSLADDASVRGMTILPAGESTKCFASLEQACGDVLSSGLERGDCVIALGGGVIGDLAGFTAAIVRRGVRYIQIPTSLLAQVDSSVGGKTGINTKHGKNLIGSFHQPHLVLADIAALSTLPDREMRAGYAEVVKYGLLGDRDFYQWLDDNANRVLAREGNALKKAVRRSVEMKAEIVARDETEQGDRALLNLGHTFCHALEAWTGYSSRLLHGEGVAVGMSLAARFSEELGYCPPQTAAQVTAHLKKCGLPTRIQDIEAKTPATADHFMDLMAQDKKVKNGQLTFILMRQIGGAFITRDVEHSRAHAFLAKQINSNE